MTKIIRQLDLFEDSDIEGKKLLNDLEIYHFSDAFDNAIEQVKEYKNGNSLPFKTCWNDFNKYIQGGIRPGMQYVVGARSGVGKSTFVLLMLNSLFEYNENNPKKPCILYFNFEMPAHYQVLKTVSHYTGKNLDSLLSVERKLEEEEYFKLKALKEQMQSFDFWFVDTSLKISSILKIAEGFARKYDNKQVIFAFDHTRLALKAGKDEMNMINDLSGLGVHLKKKYKAATVYISQLNRNIEDSSRAKSKYEPLPTDLFGADKLQQDADVIILLHRPELYNITDKDGYYDYPTKDMIFAHIKKNRYGRLGMIPFKHELGLNRIEEYQEFYYKGE